jgi:hypothetical protein
MFCIGETVAAQPAPRAAAPRGWAFSYVVVVSDLPQGQVGGETSVDVLVWRGAVRVTPRASDLSRIVGPGGYILLPARDSVMYLVNPTQRSILRAQRDELPAMGSGQIGVPVTDFIVTARDRGVGAPFGPYATRQHEMEQQYTMSFEVGTIRRTMSIAASSVRTVSTQVAALDPGFRHFLEHFSRLAGPGVLNAAQRRELSRHTSVGVPVLSSTLVRTQLASDTVRVKVVASLRNVRAVPIDTIQFVSPAGFQVTDASRLLQRVRPRSGGGPP